MAKLYFRYGAMGSSKSANILMVRYNYEERGQYAVLLKPRTDNRDGEHEIKSRIGLEAPAEYVDEFLKEISETWSADSGEYRYHGKKVDAVLIDEAQFLSPEEVDTLSDIVDFYEIPVLCYGLRADFQTHLFPGSMQADGDRRRHRGSSDGLLVRKTGTVQYEICKRKNRAGRCADFPWIE